MAVLEELETQLSEFNQLSERIKKLLLNAQETVTNGRVPSGGEMSYILSSTSSLRDRYEAIYNLAVQGSLEDSIPEPDQPVAEYEKVIHANVQREENERARSKLEHFSCVTSDTAKYRDVLEPFQQNIKEVLASNSIDAILASLEAPAFFMQGLTDGIAPDNFDLIDAIEQKFNRFVLLGLIFKAYFDPTQVVVTPEPKSAPALASKPQATIDVPSQPVSAKQGDIEGKKYVAINQDSLKKDAKLSASTFLNDIADIAKTKPDVLAILPIFMRFGILNLTQLLCFYHWVSTRSMLHDIDIEKSKFFEDFRERTLTTLDSLVAKGFLVSFNADIANGDEEDEQDKTFWCLSNYACGCMKKEKVIQQKTRTGSEYWRFSYNPNTCCIFQSGGTVAESALMNSYAMNGLLIRYLDWMFNIMPNKFISAFKSLKWRTDHYQVDVYCSDAEFSCSFMSPDGYNVGENVLIMYGLTVLPEKFNDDCKQVFALKGKNLYLCNPVESIDEQLKHLKPVVTPERGSREPDDGPSGGGGASKSDDSEDSDSDDPDGDDTNILEPELAPVSPLEPDANRSATLESLMALLEHSEGDIYTLPTPTDADFYTAVLLMLNRADKFARFANQGQNNTDVADAEILHSVLLSKAVSLENIKDGSDYNRTARLSTELQVATGILFDATYTSDCLLNCMNRATLEPQPYDSTFLLAAVLFSMIIPTQDADYALIYQNQDFYQRYDEVFNVSTLPGLRAFKPLLGKLLDVRELSPMGFPVSMLNSDNNSEDFINDLRKRAKKLLVIPPRDVKALEILYHKRLGEGSPLYKCITIITEDRRDELDFVKSVLEKYCDNSSLNGNDDATANISYKINSNLVEEDIDATWEDSLTFTKGKIKPLVSTRRTQTLRSFNERLELIVEWVSHVGVVQDNNLDIPKLKNLRDETLELIAKLLAELRNNRDNYLPYGAVLDFALRRMCDVLTGQTPYAFAELLMTGVLPMADDEPDLDIDTPNVPYYEPWRNVLRHINGINGIRAEIKSQSKSIDDVRNDILEGAGRSEYGRGDNLHQLSLIDLMLGNDAGDSNDSNTGSSSNRGISPEDEQSARELAESTTEIFRRKIEIANVYGRINSEQKSLILKYLDEYHDSFFESGDFACWRDFLRALERWAQDFTNKRKSDLLAQFDTLKAASESNMHEVQARLRAGVSLCINDGNFLVAEEYMNRLEYLESENGDNTDIADITGTNDDLDRALVQERYFENFLSDSVFKTLLQECQNHPKESLKKFGVEWVQKKLPQLVQIAPEDWLWSQHIPEDSRELLRNWPSRDVNATTAQIQLFCKRLGFNVTNVTSIDNSNSMASTSGIDRFKMIFKTEESASANAFLNIIVLYGRPTEQQLVDMVTRLEPISANDGDKVTLGGESIVLIDTPLTQTNRRSIGEISRRLKTPTSSFLLLDQVLVLYLATLPETQRIAALLRCTLPYTAYQPFGALDLPRADAKDDALSPTQLKILAGILSPNGTSLIYGGNQLGKTTLLRCAEASVNGNGNNKDYAVYSNVASCQTATDLTMQLAVEITDKTGLNLNLNLNVAMGMGRDDNSDGALSSLEQLCQKIHERIKNGNIHSLLLLLDDADNFLLHDAANATSVLQVFADLRQRTGGAFKFVLATLHNIFQTHAPHLSNSQMTVLEQLRERGKTECLKPLSRSDALQLLIRPLRRVGFNVEPTDAYLDTILANANYYPAQLNFFGYQLVEDLNSNFVRYYSRNGNLPFTLQDGRIDTVLGSASVNDHLRRSLMASLMAPDDKRYFMLACCIAWLYHLGRHGATIEEILSVAHDNDIHCLKSETTESCRALLTEMCDMGVVSEARDVQGKSTFRLLRRSFVDSIGGTQDALLEQLISNN